MRFDNKTLYYSLILLLLTSVNDTIGQQLCNGNLGINIFEEGNFGSGTFNILSQDPKIAPGYTYNPRLAAPNDGFYVITNNTQLWDNYFPSWIKLDDNSDDPLGYFMLVNADFAPGLFYRQTVDGLCENTTYEFSADIINVIKTNTSNHILPNVSFLIDGVQQFTTGDIPQDEEWHKYGFTFTTDPGQNEVILSLRNNAQGGIGNDLALDNISFQACGPSAFVSAEKTLFLCEDDNVPVEITAQIDAQDQAIQWEISIDSSNWEQLIGEGSASTFHNIFDAGRYYYRYLTAGTNVDLQNEKCRVISDVLAVDVLDLDYMLSDTICEGELYPFGNLELNSGGAYYQEFVSSRGCDSFVDLDLYVIPIENIMVDTMITQPSCIGYDDGSFEIELLNNIQSYELSLSDGTTSDRLFSGLFAGNYDLMATDENGCTTILSFQIDNPEKFIIELPSDTVVDLGEEINIEVLSAQPILSISWDPIDTSPCDNCSEFAFIPLTSQVYTATAFNQNDCEARSSIFISINIEDLDIYIPNVFETSQSSIDNSFTIGSKKGLIKSIAEFTVYDRWGNIIHQTKNTSDLALWDGRANNKETVSGIYVYLLEVELIDGNIYKYSGSFTLLR